MNRLVLWLCLCGTIVGLVLALAASGDVQIFGALGAGLAISVGFAASLSVFTRSPANAVFIDDIEGETGFLFPLSRAKATISVSLCLTLASASLLAVAFGYRAGWFGVVAFLGFFAWNVYSASGNRGLGLTPTRIVWLDRHPRGLPWEAVDSLRAFNVPKGGHALRIRVVDPEPVGGLDERVLVGLSQRVFEDLIVPINGYAGSGAFVVDTVQTYLDDPSRQARIGTPDELARIT